MKKPNHAPELLSALEALLETISFQDETNFEAVEQALSAFSKATGGDEPRFMKKYAKNKRFRGVK